MLDRDVGAVDEDDAATYGGGTRCPVNGTFTTQNVVTVPVGKLDLVAVGTPSVGQAPRGGR